MINEVRALPIRFETLSHVWVLSMQVKALREQNARLRKSRDDVDAQYKV